MGDYEYTLADNLGNSRLSFDLNTSTGSIRTVQTDNYYPFGLEAPIGTIIAPKNEYLYNKKELQEEFGQYDYGARFYDPVIGRFTTVYPLVEVGQESGTPYGYVGNNPINRIDPDGRIWEDKDGKGKNQKEADNIRNGINKTNTNLSNKNAKLAARRPKPKLVAI